MTKKNYQSLLKRSSNEYDLPEETINQIVRGKIKRKIDDMLDKIDSGEVKLIESKK